MPVFDVAHLTVNPTKERIAIVVVALLLLWWRGVTVPHVLAAVVGVVFFWWFVGPGKPKAVADSGS